MLLLPGRTRRLLLRLAFFACVLGRVSVTGQDAPPGEALDASTPINDMCPVMPDEPVDPEFTVTWQGHEIGLCCSTCRRKFLRDPEKYLAGLPGFDAASSSAAGAEESEVADELDPALDANALDEGPERDDEAGSSWVAFAGRFHPLAVHFPIGLLFAAAAAEALFVLRGRSAARAAMRFCLALGALGASASALLGLAAAYGARFPGELESAFVRHRALGISTAVLALLCWALERRATRADAGARTRLLWRTLLLATAAVLLFAGFYGGTLVYGPGHLAL